MTDTQAVTPIVAAVYTIEAGLWICGLALAWRVRSQIPWATAERPRVAIAFWEIPGLFFVLAAAAVVLGGAVAQGAVGWLGRSHFPAWTTEPDEWLVIQSAAFQGGLLAAILIAIPFLQSKRYRPTLLDGAPPAPSAPAAPTQHLWRDGVATFLIVLPVVSAVTVLWQRVLQLFGVKAEPQAMVEIFAKADSAAQVVLMTLIAALLAPIGEELAFRAGFFRFMHGRLPRVAALIAPAVIFSVLHGSLIAFPPLAALAIVFSLAYERTGDVRVTIIAHALFNLHTILLICAGVPT